MSRFQWIIQSQRPGSTIGQILISISWRARNRQGGSKTLFNDNFICPPDVFIVLFFFKNVNNMYLPTTKRALKSSQELLNPYILYLWQMSNQLHQTAHKQKKKSQKYVTHSISPCLPLTFLVFTLLLSSRSFQKKWVPHHWMNNYHIYY